MADSALLDWAENKHIRLQAQLERLKNYPQYRKIAEDLACEEREFSDLLAWRPKPPPPPGPFVNCLFQDKEAEFRAAWAKIFELYSDVKASFAEIMGYDQREEQLSRLLLERSAPDENMVKVWAELVSTIMQLMGKLKTVVANKLVEVSTIRRIKVTLSGHVHDEDPGWLPDEDKDFSDSFEYWLTYGELRSLSKSWEADEVRLTAQLELKLMPTPEQPALEVSGTATASENDRPGDAEKISIRLVNGSTSQQFDATAQDKEDWGYLFIKFDYLGVA